MPKVIIRGYDFLKSRSPEGLRDAIRDHQIKTGNSYKYQIYSDGQNHLAWYFGDYEVTLESKKIESSEQEIDLKEKV